MRASYQHWDPGTSCGLHLHRDAGELFVILEGACDLEVSGELRRCTGGDAVYVEPGEPHRLTAVGDEALVYFLAVFPNHSPRTTWVRDDGTLEEEG